MDTTQITSLITSTVTTYGTYALIILTAVIGVGVAYLIYWLGWRAIKNVVMGSHGQAFNLHGEAKDLTPYQLGKLAGYAPSDERFYKDFKAYKKRHPRANEDSFAEEYFDN